MTKLRHRPTRAAIFASTLMSALVLGGAGGCGGGTETTGGAAGAGGAGASGGAGGGAAGAGPSGAAGTAGMSADAGGAAGSAGTAGAAGSATGAAGAAGSRDAGGGAAGAGGGGAGADGGVAGSGGDGGGTAGAGARGGAGAAAGRGGAGGAAGRGGAGGAAGRGGTGGVAGRGGAGGGSGAAGTSAGGASGAGGALPAITVWLAGDSTVAAGSAPCPIGWGAGFQALFGSRATVVNDAIAGRSVRTWLYSVQSAMDSTGECVLDTNTDGTPVLQSRWQQMLTGMKAGDYLLIQFGINDSDSTCPRHVGISAFKTSYGMMAQAATDRGAHPIFITPTSSISCSGTTAVATRGSYVPATKDAGTQYNVPVIDLNAATVALYNAMSFCPVPGGDVSASTTGPVGDFFCDDHTHYSATGAPQIAALVAQAIKSQGLPLAAYLK